MMNEGMTRHSAGRASVKVSVKLTITVDADSWRQNYYEEVPTDDTIREEVAAMVEYMYDKRGIKVTVR